MWSVAACAFACALGCQTKKAEPAEAAASANATASAGLGSAPGSASVSLTPLEPGPVPAAELAKLYLACFEALNRGDFKQLGACYADDAVGRRFQGQLLESQGRDAVLAAGPKGFRDSFSDGKVVPQVVLVRGADVAMWAVQSGTQSGALPAPAGKIEATGGATGQLVLHSAHFGKDKLIHEDWLAQDLGTTLFQLGKGVGKARPRNVQGLVNAPIVVVASPDDAEKPGAELVKKWLVALARKDFATGTALLADSVVESDQAAPEDVSGKAAVAASSEAFWRPLASPRLACPVLWGAAQYVLARCTLSADRAAGAGGPLARTLLELYELSGNSIQRITRFSTDGPPAPK